MDMATRKRVFGIIKAVANVDPATLDPDKNMRDQINLDSMQFVAVIAKLENDLNIELPISAMEAETLGEFLAVLDGELDKTTEPVKN
jgi:acyl carrier protein